ncbi:MAG TPA: hypothetical protein VGN72_06190 [Tepidisphaeraceae bacterium]|nr:hypothetical protein [Tepidisphaeraceae bacterium]
MPPINLDYAPGPEFDTGRFVARYLQVLAWLMIGSMVLEPIISDSLHIDLSPILLFWAASALKRRSRTARKWVLVLGGLTLCGLAILLVQGTVSGTMGMTVKIGTHPIANPPLWLFASVTVLSAGVVAVPFAVLLSDRASKQFGVVARTDAETEALADRLSQVR